MPFVSKAQERWGNSPSGLKALGGKAAVSEWNAATPQRSLPERSPGALKQAAKKAKEGK